MRCAHFKIPVLNWPAMYEFGFKKAMVPPLDFQMSLPRFPILDPHHWFVNVLKFGYSSSVFQYIPYS